MKPIRFIFSLIIFSFAGLLFLCMERVILPWLDGYTINKAMLFLIMGLPHVLFFAGALTAYRSEGNQWRWKDLLSRFRYRPIRGEMWLWTLLIVAVDIGLYLAVYQLAYPVVKWVHDAFPTPEVVTDIIGDRETFAGYAVKGNWLLLPLYLYYYFFNVVGEELLWRGYLFPRQEKTHGKYTWLVHGLLWTMFHLFAPYNAIMVLPGALLLSYVVQRTQNNTIFLIAHAVMNGIPLVGLILRIAG